MTQTTLDEFSSDTTDTTTATDPSVEALRSLVERHTEQIRRLAELLDQRTDQPNGTLDANGPAPGVDDASPGDAGPTPTLRGFQ